MIGASITINPDIFIKQKCLWRQANEPCRFLFTGRNSGLTNIKRSNVLAANPYSLIGEKDPTAYFFSPSGIPDFHARVFFRILLIEEGGVIPVRDKPEAQSGST